MSGGSAGRYASPLRYPGGKGKVTNFFKLLLLDNDLVGTDYVEPYAGGASVALNLLFEDYVGQVFINDLNPGVHAFWDATLNATSDLCDRILATPVTIEEWRRQREVQRALAPEPLDLAFSTFFLNRTNRSGIIGGGVIGGLNQKGPYKIDARYNAEELVRRIRKIGRHRDRITVSQCDALALLDEWTTTPPGSALLYLDPPYFVKGERLYDNFYGEDDHAAIASAVKGLDQAWVVSYDAAPEINKLYKPARSIRYGLSYSAAARQTGSEVMFFSADLAIPGDLPGGIPTDSVEQARLPLSLT